MNITRLLCKTVYGQMDDLVENEESRERRRSEEDEHRLNVMTQFVQSQCPETVMGTSDVDMVTTSMSRTKLSDVKGNIANDNRNTGD